MKRLTVDFQDRENLLHFLSRLKSAIIETNLDQPNYRFFEGLESIDKFEKCVRDIDLSDVRYPEDIKKLVGSWSNAKPFVADFIKAVISKEGKFPRAAEIVRGGGFLPSYNGVIDFIQRCNDFVDRKFDDENTSNSQSEYRISAESGIIADEIRTATTLLFEAVIKLTLHTNMETEGDVQLRLRAARHVQSVLALLEYQEEVEDAEKVSTAYLLWVKALLERTKETATTMLIRTGCQEALDAIAGILKQIGKGLH